MTCAIKRERVGVLVERDDLERQSADDLATTRDAEFLADALLTHQVAAAAQQPLPRGVCANCGEACAPRAVYCDEDCKADHEQRVRARARLGRA